VRRELALAVFVFLVGRRGAVRWPRYSGGAEMTTPKNHPWRLSLRQAPAKADPRLSPAHPAKPPTLAAQALQRTAWGIAASLKEPKL